MCEYDYIRGFKTGDIIYVKDIFTDEYDYYVLRLSNMNLLYFVLTNGSVELLKDYNPNMIISQQQYRKIKIYNVLNNK